MINWNLATNDEIQQELQRIEKDYKNAQELVASAMVTMDECATKYEELKNILSKRNGQR